MSTIPEVIWILIGVLLFSIILVVGFNTTLGDFLQRKLVKTILCFATAACFSVGFILLLQATIVASQRTIVIDSTVISPAVGAAICGAIVSIAILIWFYKIKDSKDKNPKKH